MPVPEHNLMTWKGVFGSAAAPLEEWQFSLKSVQDVNLPEDDLNLLASGMSSAYITDLRALMPATVILTECEFAQIDAQGLYRRTLDGAYRRGIWNGTSAGSAAASGKVPLQTALAVSLVTARSGPTGKGRFYLPFPAMLLSEDFRLDTAQVTSIATATATFVKDAGLVAGQVHVCSSKGYTSPVTGVRVGRAPDTQRRRRGDMIEGYVAAALPA